VRLRRTWSRDVPGAFKSIEKIEPAHRSSRLNTIAIRVPAAQRLGVRPARGPPDRVFDTDGDGASTPELASVDVATDPHAAAEMAELRRDLAAAIADLPFKYRTAVVLRYVMGLDYAEAAQTLGIPLNTFKSNLLRGTRLLREQLASRLEADQAAEAARPSRSQPTAGGTAGEQRVGGFREPAAAADRVGRG
jgi:RNA polymerase sigma factor (sigma-70 family)